MTGSVRQVAWAKSIQAEAISNAEKVQGRLGMLVKRGIVSKLQVNTMLEVIDGLRSETRAGWWIDNRYEVVQERYVMYEAKRRWKG
jgi:hypothetical protein